MAVTYCLPGLYRSRIRKVVSNMPDQQVPEILSADFRLNSCPDTGSPVRDTARPGIRFQHLFALNAIAFVQPVLHRLESNTAFLRLEQFKLSSVICVVSILMLAIPTILLGSQLIVRTVSSRCTAWMHVLQMFVLFTLMTMTGLMWVSQSIELIMYGIYDHLLPFVAVTAGAVLTRHYVRRNWLGEVLNLMALGSVVFPAVFFFSGSVRSVLNPPPETPKKTVLRAESPAPVLVIVFDGLSGMSLLNEQHTIDAGRYPAFARLAETGTWYRNASTVHSRTVNAVPAILTGCLRPADLSPEESSYPINLLRAVYETHQYAMTVFEPFTRMCPRELLEKPSLRSTAEEVRMLLSTLSALWVNTSLPRDVAGGIRIPGTWFGFARSSEVNIRATTGLNMYAWDTDRRAQFEHFIRCIEPADKPGFYFLHVVLPHDPWTCLPSGNDYLWVPASFGIHLGTSSMNPEVWRTDPLAVNRAWQRHLMQLQFADHCLGKTLDQLQNIGLLEKSLVVVTADHGISFIPECSRREPSSKTIADLIPVPLFIKLPGQTTGRISDRNVESIDVFPTIADVLDLELTDPVDGASLLDESQPARPRKTVEGTDGKILIDPEFPEKYAAVERMLQVFGSSTSNDRLMNLNTRPELIGTSVAGLTEGASRAGYTVLHKGGSHVSPERPHQVPCYLEGELPASISVAEPVELAIALNGQIHGTTRTFTDAAISRSWSCMLPESAYRVGNNHLQIFEIHDRPDGPVFGELQISILNY